MPYHNRYPRMELGSPENSFSAQAARVLEQLEMLENQLSEDDHETDRELKLMLRNCEAALSGYLKDAPRGPANGSAALAV